ncbi:MAG: OprO/OprP family phosphate-selective porin [Planctomycetaceae bacterium]|jgi:phosphate-selective porin OprO/OprP|nr:OprO/OprP family phosphate-selective porin [Planctomycetaceae bacterium]
MKNMMSTKLSRNIFVALFIGVGLFVCDVIFAQSFAESPPSNTLIPSYAIAQNLPVYANDTSLELRVSSIESALSMKQDKPNSKKGFTRVIDGRIYFDSYNIIDQKGSSTGLQSLNNLNDYNGLRDLRVGVKGEGFDVFDYKIDLCFIESTGQNNNNSSVNLKDIWFGVNNVPLFEYVRIGQYRVEAGVSAMTGGTNTTFFEFDGREFTSGHRIGIMSRHLWARDTIRFFAGYFYDRNINRMRFDRNDNQGSITNIRLTFLPYASRGKDGKIDGKDFVFLGGHYCYYDISKPQLSATFTERFGTLDLEPLQPFTINTNRFNKFGLEFIYQKTAFTLQSEVYANVYNSVNLNGTTKDRKIWGAYITAKYFLTGDYRKFSSDTATWSAVNLKNNLDLKKINDSNYIESLGGLEVAFKWGYTDTSDFYDANIPFATQFTGSVNDLTVGLNWYWSPQARWLFDYIYVMPNQQRGTIGRDHSATNIFAAAFRYNF